MKTIGTTPTQAQGSKAAEKARLQLAGALVTNICVLDDATVAHFARNLGLVPAALKRGFVQTSDQSWFQTLVTRNINVPDDYQHNTCLEDLKKAYYDSLPGSPEADDISRSMYAFDRNLTDKNFARVSNSIKPRQKIRVSVWRQTAPCEATSTGVLKRMKSVFGARALFLGAQGLSLVWSRLREDLPNSFDYVSLDDPSKLWQSPGIGPMLPMFCKTGAYPGFRIRGYHQLHDMNTCFICFHKADS